jgi:hypothetical protein
VRLERAVYRDAVGGKHDRVTGEGRQSLPDGTEATGALAPSRDVATMMRETRDRLRKTIQDDGAALESRRMVSHATEPYG